MTVRHFCAVCTNVYRYPLFVTEYLTVGKDKTKNSVIDWTVVKNGGMLGTIPMVSIKQVSVFLAS